MDVRDYPVDVRADYPQSSSRLWAILTILWIKWFALIPHWFCLIFLGIAQFVVALVAQFVVAFGGEYPEGMHRFVTGVLRWQTRVTAFFLTVTDRYPPFSMDPAADYPVDVVARRPEQPSRTYAVFTIVVEILFIVGGIWLAVWLIGHADTFRSFSSTSSNGSNFSATYRFNNFPSFGGGLALRQLAAIPHLIVLAFLGIAAIVIWIVVQWVVLFVARFPFGMWEIETGYVRWYTRVLAYTLGLVDRYPPFSMRPSIAGGEDVLTSPPPPPPPMSGTWPQAPTAQPAAQPAAQPPAPPAPQVPGGQAAPQTPPGPSSPSRPEPPQAPEPPGS